MISGSLVMGCLGASRLQSHTDIELSYSRVFLMLAGLAFTSHRLLALLNQLT